MAPHSCARATPSHRPLLRVSKFELRVVDQNSPVGQPLDEHRDGELCRRSRWYADRENDCRDQCSRDTHHSVRRMTRPAVWVEVARHASIARRTVRASTDGVNGFAKKHRAGIELVPGERVVGIARHVDHERRRARREILRDELRDRSSAASRCP